jgi:hypothetical protein
MSEHRVAGLQKVEGHGQTELADADDADGRQGLRHAKSFLESARSLAGHRFCDI